MNQSTDPDNLLTPSMFAATVEGLVQRDGILYLEAIMEFGERYNIELEVLQSLVRKSPTIKSKLQAESVRFKRIAAGSSAEIAFA